MIPLRLLRLTAAIFFGDTKKGITSACDRFAIMIFDFDFDFEPPLCRVAEPHNLGSGDLDL